MHMIRHMTPEKLSGTFSCYGHADHCLSPGVDGGGQDLGQQKLAILEYARQHRMTVDDVVEVHGSTRRATQRAHVLALIETLSPGDRLMVSELSRLGRSLGQILQIVGLCRKSPKTGKLRLPSH